MAKEEKEVEQASRGNEETRDPALALTEHLRRMAKDHSKVDVGGEQLMLSGEVKDVRVAAVWAYFTVGRIGYRTTTTADKEALLRGETAVHLTKMFEQPEPQQAEVKPIETRQKSQFIPRSRRSLGYGPDIAIISN